MIHLELKYLKKPCEMKNKLLILFSLFLIITSCSSDDDTVTPVVIEIPNNGTPQVATTGDFFPLSASNEWNFNVVNTNNGDNTSTNSVDVLKVETVNTDSYTLSVNNNTVANGTLNSLLVSGEVKTTDTQLTSTGSLDLPIGIGNDLSIAFTDAKFYDTTKNINQEIYTTSGVINQTFNTIPLTIDYTLNATQLDNLDTYTNNGVTYINVTSARINLNVSVNATVTIIVTTVLPVIDPQNVLTIDAYYADGIGLIYAEAASGYTLNANTVQLLTTAGVDLGNIPTTLSLTNTQTIDTYTVN